ncbi:flavodoxin family protein [Enterococcus sp. RIT-PI-f]|uniref:flavodoxin family protein n=1 Tax=Enterococcus sp. RIT-PI-f TaxID=1690244 RepID=UPI0006B9748D|nr:flavodoxin family protein [Enterococcus sp. RIT-PI-f]KPG69955.1 NADPH-dependent fmn reductase [Enterococcus sp. RIT-PI-f]
MPKVVVLIGSRNKRGATYAFSRKLVDSLAIERYETEYLFPQDFTIKPCLGCARCFLLTRCVQKDDLLSLQKKILDSDVLIIASPVYLHYMTADLKLILDRSAWWSHTLRLQGKPTVVLSTCSSNGQTSVTKPLSEIMTWMGANVIATANASKLPDQLGNEQWLQSVGKVIADRIEEACQNDPQSNRFLEEVFQNTKRSMESQRNAIEDSEITLGEVEYWEDSGMFYYDTFQEYLTSTGKIM